ncbi:MAG: histidine kinase dimerization/phosphoacceptor domain-containing protein, partial [Actinomycetota bacterium]
MTVIANRPSDGGKLPTAADLALAASLLVVALLSGLYLDTARPDTVTPTAWWQWLLLCAPPALVAVRRIDPVVVTALATVAQAAVWVSNLPEVLLPVIVILYTAASEAGRRGRVAAIVSSVILTAVTTIGVRLADDVTVSQVPLVALTCGTAIVLGVTAANQRAAAGELAAAVTSAELRAEHAREHAVADERAHIGRELHDIIGHSLSVIAVRAEAADRVADRQPEAARAAVSDIAGAARSALSETRRILSGLQRSSSAELAPPPDLAALAGLVDELAATGVAVTLTSDGCDQHP